MTNSFWLPDVRRRPLRRGGPGVSWPLVLAAVFFTACFDEPVAERLRLRFVGEGALFAELDVELRYPEPLSAALERRLRELEATLLGGEDAWAARFAAAGESGESLYWEKEAGRLVRFERTALLPDPAAVEELFSGTPILAAYESLDDGAELALFPGQAGRASRRERRRMERVLDEWSGAVAAYLAAGAELWAYLEERPERAGDLFAALFDEGDEGTASAEEEALLEGLAAAMGEVWSVLEIAGGDDASLDELSRRVFDPFPARIEVEVPGPVGEVEGFVRHGEVWRVPGLGLWPALERLAGRWLAPDPVTAYVAHLRAAPDAPFDARAFAERERFAAPRPEAGEVREALVEELTPADVYRLSWAGSR